MLYPKLVHLTCLSHGLHCIAEIIRYQYPEVEALVSNVKKVFVKAPSRVRLFRELAKIFPLPPQPVIGRWGSWLEAVSYYAENLNEVKAVIDSIQPEDAAAICVSQKCFSRSGIENEIKYIHNHFSSIPAIITQSPVIILCSIHSPCWAKYCKLCPVKLTVSPK